MGTWPGHRGYTPTLYEKCHGIFNNHRESGPRFNVSSERRCCFTVQCPRHYTGVLGPTQTTEWAPPAGLTNTSSSSNLVFPGGLPSRYWPGSTLLSFSGQPVLGCGVIWWYEVLTQCQGVKGLLHPKMKNVSLIMCGVAVTLNKSTYTVGVQWILSKMACMNKCPQTSEWAKNLPERCERLINSYRKLLLPSYCC